MIAIFAAFLVRELGQVFRGRTAGTLSNLVWVVLGARYSVQWFAGMGVVAGLCVWLVAHFGWHASGQVLLVLWAAFLTAGLVAYFAAHALL